MQAKHRKILKESIKLISVAQFSAKKHNIQFFLNKLAAGVGLILSPTGILHVIKAGRCRMYVGSDIQNNCPNFNFIKGLLTKNLVCVCFVWGEGLDLPSPLVMDNYFLPHFPPSTPPLIIENHFYLRPTPITLQKLIIF